LFDELLTQDTSISAEVRRTLPLGLAHLGVCFDPNALEQLSGSGKLFLNYIESRGASRLRIESKDKYAIAPLPAREKAPFERTAALNMALVRMGSMADSNFILLVESAFGLGEVIQAAIRIPFRGRKRLDPGVAQILAGDEPDRTRTQALAVPALYGRVEEVREPERSREVISAAGKPSRKSRDHEHATLSCVTSCETRQLRSM
jgi:hypothetical protein